MMYFSTLALLLAIAQAAPDKHRSPQGIDVSSWQPTVDWTAVANSGVKFAYIKATEAYTSPTYPSQYDGAANAGLIRGAYHFARPANSPGADQAKYFEANGGSWSPDGITLPGALDIEYNPGGPECYNMTATDLVSWIREFSDTYLALTNRYPVIYTTTSWWSTCTGNSAAFSDNPLWIADWSSQIGPLPAGWEYTSFWQYADSGPNPGDADLWNGDYAGLKRMACGN